MTGNDMFEMVKEDCRRVLGKKKGVLFYGPDAVYLKTHWFETDDVSIQKRMFGKYTGEIINGTKNEIES